MATQAKRRNDVGGAPEDNDGGDAVPVEDVEVTPSTSTAPPARSGTGQNFKELPPTPKPEMKYSRKSKDRDEIQMRMLSMLQQENVPPAPQKDDYLDLAFASIAERMRVRMTPDQQEDLLMDINQLVNDAFRQLRRGKVQQVPTSAPVQPRQDLPDMAMVSAGQGGQQFTSGNIPSSSNEMYGPTPNQPQFQGFTYMNL